MSNVDQVAVWADETLYSGGSTRSTVLYNAFFSWYRDSVGDDVPSQAEFYRELVDMGYPSRKSGGVMVRDLSFKDDVAAHDDSIKITWTSDDTCTVMRADAAPDVDDLAAAYSRHGQNLTAREVAEAFGISEDIVKLMLKNAGVRKSDPPFSADTLDSGDTDELVERGLEYKRNAYKVKAARAERRDLERRVEAAESAMRDHDARREHIKNGIAAALRTVDPPQLERPAISETGRAYHFPIADSHVGLQVYGKEAWTGENYHTDLAADRIVEAASKAAGWIDSMRSVSGAPRVVHFSIIGDLFHALHYATVAGRPMQVDGRQRRVFEKVVNAVATAIVQLAEVSAVEARLTDGNHDGDLVFYVATALAAYFKDVPHVNVQTSYNHQCSFFEGETLHVLDHGRTVTALDSPRAQAGMATVVREIGEMYPPHRRAKVWVGDKHSPAAAWHGRHTELIRVPALASLDDYAQGINYSHDYDAYVYALTDKGGIGHMGRLYE